MAESQRKGHTPVVINDDEAQQRKERMFLLMLLLAGVGIVVGMVFLAKFLSGQ